jgi:hypothetical protein
MSLPKTSSWHLKPRPNGRAAIFPCHRADFENLEELYDILAGPEEIIAIAGTGTIYPEYPYPHVTLTSESSKYSYMFIKKANDTYILKLVQKK